LTATGIGIKFGDNLFNIGQVHFRADPFGLPGNYRFYGWASNANHNRWLEPEKEKESLRFRH
jgi:hypothetical protein